MVSEEEERLPIRVPISRRLNVFLTHTFLIAMTPFSVLPGIDNIDPLAAVPMCTW